MPGFAPGDSIEEAALGAGLDVGQFSGRREKHPLKDIIYIRFGRADALQATPYKRKVLIDKRAETGRRFG